MPGTNTLSARKSEIRAGGGDSGLGVPTGCELGSRSGSTRTGLWLSDKDWNLTEPSPAPRVAHYRTNQDSPLTPDQPAICNYANTRQIA